MVDGALDEWSEEATPMNRDEQIAMHRKLPITTADLKALNQRVTELRRKMPDDEPNTILTCLHENGEFLRADEAHIEGALLRLEEQIAQATQDEQCSCGNREHPCVVHPDMGVE